MPRSTIRPPCWNRLKDYDSRVVQTIWEDSTSLDLPLEDPFFAQSNSQYNDLVSAAHDGIKKARKKLDPLNFNRDLFRRSSYKEQRTLDSIFRFEARMLNLNHSVCSSCFETKIDLKTTIKTSTCSRCQKKIDRDNQHVGELQSHVRQSQRHGVSVPEDSER